MRQLLLAALCVSAVSLPLTPQARAAEAKPVQLALFNPVQIFPADQSIAGIRLNILYGKNADVTGIDWGLANHVTGNGMAWQAGFVGIVEQNFTGLQDNWINITKGDCTGIQWGVFNQAKRGSGAQLGFVNMTEHMHGFQLGAVNVTDTMEGLQIGLGNIIHKGPHPFLPIVNWTF